MNVKKLLTIGLVGLLALFLGGVQVLAGSSAPGAPNGPGFTYQGQLKDDAGNPLTAACDFQFGLWDALSGGSQIGSSSIVPNAQVTGGYFTVMVNSGGEFGASAFNGETRWLAIAVRCPTGLGDYTLLDPRQVLTPTPYAVDANLLDGQDSTAFASASHGHWGTTWSGSGTGLTLSGGVTGLSGSGSTFGVYGFASATSGINYGLYGESSSPNGIGVYGTGNVGVQGGTSSWIAVYGKNVGTSNSVHVGVAGETYGSDVANRYHVGVQGYAANTAGGIAVRGLNAGEGIAVLGEANGSSALSYGVQGLSTSTAGHGVYGLASASSGVTYGVYGMSDSPAGIGVYGNGNIAVQGDTPGWLAVYGKNTGTSNSVHVGVAGETYGSDVANRYHVGVQGYAVNTAGGIAVRGLTAGEGIAVLGEANGSSALSYGVQGLSTSTAGRGVYGLASASIGITYGVYGMADSPSGIGVYGYNSTTEGFNTGVEGRADSVTGEGVRGMAYSTSGPNIGVSGKTFSPLGYGVYGGASATNANYGVYSYGNFAATGTKNAIVPASVPGVEGGTGWVHLYSMESPEVWFEDIGAGQLVNGQAVVTIDPLFASTINPNEPYHLFLTPMGECTLFVDEKTPTSFTVQALDNPACSIAFDYRIIAKRLGYEDTRLAPAEDPNQRLRDRQRSQDAQP